MNDISRQPHDNDSGRKKHPLLQGVIPALIAAFITFAVYAMTMARTIYWGDGIELSTVCDTLGIAHPTGYPLFTLAGYFFCRMIPQNPGLATNIMCAFFGSLAVFGFFFTLDEALKLLPAGRFLDHAHRMMIAFAGSLTLGFTATFWHHCTLTEVYTLHILFSAGLTWLFLKYIRTGSVRYFLVFFGAWGLSFTNHMLSLTLLPMAIVAIIFLMFRKETSEQKPGRKAVPILAAVILFAVGLLPYLYLPLRAAANPELNWGNPSTLENFLWLVSGGDFKKYQLLSQTAGQSFTLETFIMHSSFTIQRMMNWSVMEFFPFPDLFKEAKIGALLAMIILSVWGMILLIKRNLYIFAGLAGLTLLGIVMCLVYNIVDIEPYFLSFLPALLIFMTVAFSDLLHRIETSLSGRKIYYLPAILLFIPVMALTGHFSNLDKSENRDAYLYGEQILDHAPENAMILTITDNDIFPLWYQQKALDKRPDVTIIGTNFIHSGWYASYFQNRKQDAPDITIKHSDVPQSRGDFYLDLMLWVIEPNIKKHTILMTFTDPILEERYDVKQIDTILKPVAYERAGDSYLPPPYLYRLN